MVKLPPKREETAVHNRASTEAAARHGAHVQILKTPIHRKPFASRSYGFTPRATLASARVLAFAVSLGAREFD